MKVIHTLVATGPDGEDLGNLVKPVEMVWSSDADPLTVIESVTQILRSESDKSFTRTVAIHIEF